jgi:hypothetical protein
MKYATAAWKAERLSWRSVIQLNIIRSIVSIVKTIQLEMIGTRSSITLSKIEDDTEKRNRTRARQSNSLTNTISSSFVSGLSVVSRKTSGVVSAPVRSSPRLSTLPCGDTL